MAVLKSSISTRDERYQENLASMQGILEDLSRQREKHASGGDQRSRERHVSRGKLLPRERVMGLIDPGTPFLELSPMAAHGLYGGDIHAADRKSVV